MKEYWDKAMDYIKENPKKALVAIIVLVALYIIK